MLDKPVGHIFSSDQLPTAAPSQRLHLILLGVQDVARSCAFYEALGWQKSRTSNDGFVKFNLGGYALCLISLQAFAEDAGFAAPVGTGFAAQTTPAFSGIGLIYLARSVEEVPQILAKAVAAGGSLVKPATRTHWGVAGYFKDPDGHLFEVDYEDAWVFDGEHHLVVDRTNNE